MFDWLLVFDLQCIGGTIDRMVRLSRILFPFAILAVQALVLTSLRATTPATPELRGVWVDGFNDGFQTPTQCDLLMQRVRAAHLNAVFIQMRKRGDAFYYSNYEPWAGDDPSHFDALDYVCKLGHAPGKPRILVVAWMNTCAVGGSKSLESLPRLHPDWLSISDTGSVYDNESTKIDPGNPAAADWTYRVVLDVVRHYDIDGVILDFIRYGGDTRAKTVGHWGYNPASIARFNTFYHRTGQPLWNDPDWCAWRRLQVTNLVRRIYTNTTALRPNLIVSASTICWGAGPADDAAYEAHSASYSEVFAPWRDWLREGILDINCPMTYFKNGVRNPYWKEWAPFIRSHQAARMSTMAAAIYLNSIPDSLDLIRSTREPDAAGNKLAGVILYSYSSDDLTDGVLHQYDPAFWDALPTVFPTDAPVPALPWKIHPTNGELMGVLFRHKTLAVSDGDTVTLTSKSGAHLDAVTDGNGFFSFPVVSPGPWDVTLNSHDSTSGSKRDLGGAYVTAGKAAVVVDTQDGTLRQRVSGIGALRDGEEIGLANAVVTVGSRSLTNSFYIADEFGRFPVRVITASLVPPTVPGDRVAIHGVIGHEHGATTITADAVRQLGAELIPSLR